PNDESFKIIVKGKVFCVRAKELFVWNPTFKDIPEAVHCSDDESIKGEAEMNGEDSKLNNDGDASDSEVVSDTLEIMQMNMDMKTNKANRLMLRRF
ncbi:hypothetical protein Tco_1526769, partial [Tanacetum coccineum]